MHLARREPDRDHEFQIHQGVAGKQDRQIDRKCLDERHYQHGDDHEFDRLADREAVEKSRKLHHKGFPQHVADRERAIVLGRLDPERFEIPLDAKGN